METIKQNRAISFFVIAVVYVLAAVSGVLAYRYLPFDFWLNLLLADIIATAVTFLFSLLFGNASVYDPYWSMQPVFILTAFALGRTANLSQWLLLIAVWIWGLRLTANWAYTFHGLTHQDWRYTMLRENSGAFYPFVNFFGIHLVPTLIVYLCTLPGVFLILDGRPANAGSFVFFLLSVFAVTLQGLSDLQMHSFRAKKTHGLIRNGFWKNSRHPNYLGEILMWWGFGLQVVSVMPERFWLLAGALANTLMFLFISIPMADKRQSEKPGFEEYRSETRMLLPIPRRG